LGFINQFFIDAINAIWQVTGDYGLAIIIFSVILRILIAPAQHIQMASTRRLREVAPLRQAIEKRYKGNPQRIQEETMRLYKEYNISPTASCLPFLLQIPIIWIFFSVMRNFEYLGPANFLWIADLSQPDLWILPILAGVTTFLQSKITMPPTDGENFSQTMLYVMPIFIIWVSRQVPAGLALYWVVSNVFAVVQQLVYPPGGRGEPREATG